MQGIVLNQSTVGRSFSQYTIAFSGDFTIEMRWQVMIGPGADIVI